jgi:transposase InsO family protein
MTTDRKLIMRKISLLDLAEELKNVSEACRIMRVSRDTFYRVKNAYTEEGMEGLREKTRRKPNLSNRVPSEVETAVVAYSLEHPTHGQVRVSDELRRQDVWVSPGGVRCIWLRAGLENRRKRLERLEAQVREAGLVLTAEQVEALERLRVDERSDEEIETEHPGYLLAQDTFYVGVMKGVGRIYLQSVIDTYSRVGFGKLYTSKLPVTSADALNDRVLPFFEARGVPVLRILTDRGTEYCGRLDQHPYELFLALNDIEHTKTKVRSPQTNGICERFHQTILQDFFRVEFRKRLYTDVAALQRDLDGYLERYNTERPHQGKRCDGKTPMETFQQGKAIVEEKKIA